MGGNQSKTVNRSSFTSEQAYEIAADINAQLNIDMKSDGSAKATAGNKGVKIGGVKNSTVTLSPEATARVEIAQAVSISLDFLKNDDVSSCVALDVLNGLKSESEQKGGGVSDSTTSENVTDTTFKLSTAISCCQNLQASIGVVAVGMAEASAINEDIQIGDIENSNITLSPKAIAESLISQLGDLAQKAAAEMKNTSSTDAKAYNDLIGTSEQKGALESLNEFGQNLVNTAGDVANNAVNEVGETAREGIGIYKWLIIAPIIVVIAIIAFILLFKLIGGRNKNQMPMNYQPTMQQPMNYQQLQYNQQHNQNQQPMMQEPQMEEPQIEEPMDYQETQLEESQLDEQYEPQLDE